MEFGLFILLNGILLMRPEDTFPAIAGTRLYLITIIILAGMCLPKVLQFINPAVLAQRPMIAVILLYHMTFWLSRLNRFEFGEAFDLGGEFAKILLYSLLFAAIIDTRERFNHFMGWIVVFTLASVLMALLDFHDILHFETIEHVPQPWTNPETGEHVILRRMAGVGLFGDPNDLGIGIIIGTAAALYRMGQSQLLLTKFLWLLPFPVYAMALLETQSKGAMLGMLAAVSGFIYGKFGIKRAIPLIVLVAVGMLTGVSGRQSEISGSGTAWERMVLWSEGIGTILLGPRNFIFGIGALNYADFFGLVAHNSFVHAYVELGVLGGGCYLFLFYLPARVLYDTPTIANDDWANRARPYIWALLAGYVGGAYSLSRNYTLVSFLVIGLLESHLHLRGSWNRPQYQIMPGWFQKLCIFSLIGAIGIKLMTQLLMRVL